MRWCEVSPRISVRYLRKSDFLHLAHERRVHDESMIVRRVIGGEITRAGDEVERAIGRLRKKIA